MLPVLTRLLDLSSNATEDGRIPWPGPDSPNIRSSYDILWTCLVTIFACIYTSLHMDLPTGERPRWMEWCWKVFCVAINLVAPEFVALYAVQQYWECRDLCDWLQRETRYAYTEWSLTHSYYFTMGGLVVQLPGGAVSPAQKEDIRYFLQNGVNMLSLIRE